MHSDITSNHKQHLFYVWRADAQKYGVLFRVKCQNWWCYLIVLNCTTASSSLSATQSPCFQVRIQSEVQVTRVQRIFLKRTQLNYPSKLCQLVIAEIHLRRESPLRNYLYRLVCGKNYGDVLIIYWYGGGGTSHCRLHHSLGGCSGLYKKVN